MFGKLLHNRHCERSEAIQSLSAVGFWIASAFAKGFGGQVAALAMTECLAALQFSDMHS
ncbi:hypothetical protein JQ617_38290 [Bradyrhizobium sp. KB893862 SZCCT0404]|uniref:hypothetical protein n=1 Tax=Bradyrhizobium sp. KB893862 SZCCT0404 TaxID=2807672 RepID=UPI001BAB7DD4|nr:hypothetical protein [Bradyrhizobium sp. KB893862 SZCCT0404]MBR1179870.1 hypothetical protein [Bradyrhizobium sp. KB893862 SZCCT0404]